LRFEIYDLRFEMASVPESDGARPESDLEKKRKEIPESESDLEKKRRKNDDLEAGSQSQEEFRSVIIDINEDSLFNEYYIPNYLITDQEREILEEMTKEGTCSASGSDAWKEWWILLNLWDPDTEQDCVRDMKTEYPEFKDYDTAGKWFPYLIRNRSWNPRCECRADHLYIFHTYS
jgi:hypothetical protein